LVPNRKVGAGEPSRSCGGSSAAAVEGSAWRLLVPRAPHELRHVQKEFPPGDRAGVHERRSVWGSDHSTCGDRPDDNQCGRLPGAHLQRLRSSRNIVDYRSPLHRSAASDSEADTEPEHERHTEPHWVNKWNEARSRLGDLKSPDRAGAHTSAASASGSISRGLWAQARSTTGPKAIPTRRLGSPSVHKH
jgi:hypothetical protein